MKLSGHYAVKLAR